MFFEQMDVEIVQHFNTCVLCINEEGKRKVQASTLFFMPHCGFSLYFDSHHLLVDTTVLYGRIGESRSRA